mmetsp:Transcript_19112/g.24726  ORF Transcript_19112/g.24726 Transcript_19112/m.24726 type:complete len:127 (+) Transcript_19112:1100-1480(+)
MRSAFNDLDVARKPLEECRNLREQLANYFSSNAFDEEGRGSQGGSYVAGILGTTASELDSWVRNEMGIPNPSAGSHVSDSAKSSRSEGDDQSVDRIQPQPQNSIASLPRKQSIPDLSIKIDGSVSR